MSVAAPSKRRALPFGNGILACVVGAALALPLLSSCEDTQQADACTNIPEGGCPLSRGVACEDPSCKAVYACRAGNVWELDRMCPPRDAGGPRDSSAPDVPSPPLVRDADTDAPPGASGGPGCGLLQAPDCPLGTALACPPSAGCCECEDLFVCESGAWSLWGTCSLDAGIRATP